MSQRPTGSCLMMLSGHLRTLHAPESVGFVVGDVTETDGGRHTHLSRCGYASCGRVGARSDGSLAPTSDRRQLHPGSRGNPARRRNPRHRRLRRNRRLQRIRHVSTPHHPVRSRASSPLLGLHRILRGSLVRAPESTMRLTSHEVRALEKHSGRSPHTDELIHRRILELAEGAGNPSPTRKSRVKPSRGGRHDASSMTGT